MNKTSNISFSSRINFVSARKLSKMAYMTHGNKESQITIARPDVKEIWEGGIDEVKNLNKNEKGITGGIIYCLAGIFKKTNDTLMFHFYPPDAIVETPKIQNDINKIDKNEKLKGILIGGLYSNKKGQKFLPIQSLDLFGRLKKILKEFPNKDFSIFYGQNIRKVKGLYPASNKIVNILYDNSADEYFINIDRMKLTPENIKKRFKFIRISPNDEVFIKGQKIDSKLIET